MRILHLFSNVKLTGPAEPVLNLVAGLTGRGLDVVFACGRFHAGERSSIEERAEELGIFPVTDFRLKKHFSFVDNARDLPALAQFISEQEIDVIHTHLLNDHLLGGWAARHCDRPVLVVRTVHSLGRLWGRLRARYLARNLTDALIVGSAYHHERARGMFEVPQDRIWRIEPAIDLQRFNPQRPVPDMRRELGIDEGDFVVGIVARIQKRRRFDIFLHAVRDAREQVPHLKALVVGRGTHREEIADKPARKLGIEDAVIFSGYRKGDEYTGLLKAMDLKVFLVPGTDETCRAIREAMAMGRPVVGARRGIIHEIIDDGVNGFVVKDTPANLAQAFIRLARDRDLLEQFSRAALQKAREKFNLEKYVEQVIGVYHALSGRPPAAGEKTLIDEEPPPDES
jgi:glycosyltransferase involved in cell wall biosynthesis